jgi:hypothetical protein
MVKNAADGWSAAVAWHRGNPRLVRVRESAPCSSGEVPGTAATADEPDAPATEQGYGTTIIDAAECEARVNNAILDAAQVMHLQRYVTDVQKAMK